MILIGLVVILLVIFIRRKSYQEYKEGKKFVGMSYIEDEPYYKKKYVHIRFYVKCWCFFSFWPWVYLFCYWQGPIGKKH